MSDSFMATIATSLKFPRAPPGLCVSFSQANVGTGAACQGLAVPMISQTLSACFLLEPLSSVRVIPTCGKHVAGPWAHWVRTLLALLRGPPSAQVCGAPGNGLTRAMQDLQEFVSWLLTTAIIKNYTSPQIRKFYQKQR